jgi:hypothetical protein
MSMEEHHLRYESGLDYLNLFHDFDSSSGEGAISSDSNVSIFTQI